MSKRKSCPVYQRPFLELNKFNKNDKNTYDGTESVRGLNKFHRKWFGENAIAIIYCSKSFYGRTFVVPYVDIEGVRYWIIDKEKKERNLRKIEKYENNAVLH